MELLVSTHSDSYWSGVFFYFYIKQVFIWSIQTDRQTDRQTDILLTERKSIQTYLS